MNKKNINFWKAVNSTFGILCLSGLLLISSCNSSDDEGPDINVDNLSFEEVMPVSPFFTAEGLSASVNGRYIFASVRSGTSFLYYFSKDAGESFSEISLNLRDRRPIVTNISNDGKMIIENIIVDLENGTETSIRQTSFNLYHFVTESGKLLSFQGRINEIKLYEVRGSELFEIDVEINFNPFFAAGVSGEKIGFYDYQQRQLLEFDASTNTITERSLANVNYSLIGGGPFRSNRTVTAYSEGYFALAKEGGVLVIAPDGQVQHYPYTDGFANFMNTAAIAMTGGKVFVSLFRNTGEPAVFESNGSGLEQVPFGFPLVANPDHVLATGFIENGDRAFSGLIKYRNGAGSYLNGDLNNQGFNAGPAISRAFEVEEDIYFEDKVYNMGSETYRSSPLAGISKMLYLESRHIAYTANGTYQSFDGGANWEATGNTIQPTYVVKDQDGTWYGMTISYEKVFLGGTGFSVDNYGHKVYTSSDPATGWTFLPGSEKSGFRQHPQGLSSDGIVRVIDDIGSGLGNSVPVLQLSRDYGVTYETYSLEEETPDDKTSEFETSDGRKVTVFISQGILNLTIASLNSDDCATSEIVLPEAISFRREYSITSDERFLISGTGVYRSDRL